MDRDPQIWVRIAQNFRKGIWNLSYLDLESRGAKLFRTMEWGKVIQSCPTLCDTMDCSPPGSSVLGIFQARMLEWFAIPSPGDLPDPGMEPRSPALQADSLPSEPPGKPLRTAWDRGIWGNAWAATLLPYLRWGCGPVAAKFGVGMKDADIQALLYMESWWHFQMVS